MSLPLLREHTDAVIATLQVAGLSVGDGESPLPPSCAVYSIPGGRSFGTLASPNEDADLVYQVTCVGTTREQADWVADKATAALLAGFAVAGRTIKQVDIDSLPGTRRDDTASPAVFIATPRFVVRSSP